MIYTSKIISKKEIAEGTLEVSFSYPEDFSFKAGQYMQIGVHKLLHPDNKGASRVMSIVSSPLDKEKISIAFRDTDSGFKNTLKESPLGTAVKIEGPYGFFTLPPESEQTLVFVAGGIGVTPYVSMIRFASQRGFNFPIILLYANRNKKSAAYLEELQNIANHNKEYFSIKNKFGRIDEQFIQQSVKDLKSCKWHIAGPPGMVDYTRNTLSLLGVDNEQIHFEEFAGY